MVVEADEEQFLFSFVELDKPKTSSADFLSAQRC